MLKQGHLATCIWRKRREVKCSPDIYRWTDTKFALPIAIGRSQRNSVVNFVVLRGLSPIPIGAALTMNERSRSKIAAKLICCDTSLINPKAIKIIYMKTIILGLLLVLIILNHSLKIPRNRKSLNCQKTNGNGWPIRTLTN